jgi:predicted membrane-bound spermidine synthase
MFAVGGVLFGANLWALFVTSEFTNFHAHMRPLYGIIVGFCFVALAAALLSITFPLLCHLAIDPNQKAGSKLSFIYVSNIIGSSAGSLIFGYIMFEYFSLRTLSLVLGGMGLGLGIVVMACARTSAKRILACSIIALLALGVARIRLANTYEALSGLRWTEVLENRHDVITVSPDGAIFSGGGYDGLFNTDPVDNSNWILRIYAALSLQSAPHKVLMVGLSSGSWAQVIVNDPRVEHLTVVEINPGYLKIIPNHPQVSSLLGNPKLNVVIDDGRRWLLSHPAERYDLIVMNTPFHWRANMTNLLSREFIGIVRQHLQPDGVYFFNTTFSPDAQFTAYAAFHNVVRIANFVAASDGPLQLHKNQLTEMLLDYRIDGRRVIPYPPARGVFQEFAAINQQIDLAQIGSPRAEIFEYGPSLRMKLQGARVVTDDNMAVEWNRDLAAQ